MTKKNWQRFLFFTFIASFSIYIGYYLTPKTNPSISGLPKITDDSAEQIARDFLKSHDINPEQFNEYSYFVVDESSSNFIISKLGLEKYSEISSTEQLPLSFWHINYLLNVPRNAEEERIVFSISPSGKILSYQHFLPDSIRIENIDSLEALNTALAFMENWPGKKLSGFKLEEHNTYTKPNRIDNEFTFTKSFPGLNEGQENIHIYLAGKRLITLRNFFSAPTEANVETVGGANILLYALSILVYFIVTIMGIIKFLKLYHDGQIGVRYALIAGSIIYFTQVIYIFNIWDGFAEGTGIGSISHMNTRWIVFGIQVLISYVYVFVNSFTTWAVGDYYLRTEKPGLLAGTDSIMNKKFFSKNIGKELPVGFAFGAVTFGIFHVINFLLIEFTSATPLSENLFIGSEIPVLAMILLALIPAFFDEIVFRKFFVTYLKMTFNSKSIAFLGSGLLYAFFSIFFGEYVNFWPTYITLIPFFVYGVIQAWVFWNYGLLASMSSAVLFTSLINLSYIFNAENPVFTIQGLIFIAILLSLLISGIMAFLKGEEFNYSQKSEPDHIRRIKERLRMQQELDIAKKVQLGLLPKEQPTLAGFDIAGVCIPALEVGGDYFDFINLKDGRLGLAIADVSGKGVPAAIYMTLTKGILQSHAESDLSPKTVLSKVNSLMYRTIEKSWYVSMFYAVLDPTNKKLVFSRAGHNPAIVLNRDKSNPHLLQPAGIGLGLEMGDIFTKTLVEGELQLETGNTLIFYTDGFTEAMNDKGEEYSEERFLKFLNENDNGSSSELLKKAIDEINSFSDGAPQHDDMTMVVLKVY